MVMVELQEFGKLQFYHIGKSFYLFTYWKYDKEESNEYYKVIDNCNKAGNATEFIEFMLKMIDDTIDEITKTTTQETAQETTQEKF